MYAPAISDAIDFSDTTSSVRGVDNEIMSSSMSSPVLSGDGKPIMVSKTSEKKLKTNQERVGFVVIDVMNEDVHAPYLLINFIHSSIYPA
jgi:hypothetical protein